MKSIGDMAEKNYGVSNKAKLLNITRQTEGQTYMQVLLRFIQDRFLYRLSVSAYRDHFYLKGGALLYAHERFNARPTMDMDFMGDRINRDRENIRRAFLRKMKYPVVLEFSEVMDSVLPVLKPMWERLR